MPVTLLIPALLPEDGLLEVIGDLSASPLVREILLIDDGSGPSCEERFAKAVALSDKTRLIRHSMNLGKGTALRTGLNAYLASDPSADDVLVTADADGQHLPKDILAVAAEGRKHPQDLILGSRAFGESTPLRSQFGNSLTKWVFRAVTGRKLRDTQTGLRAIPRRLMPTLLRLNSRRYQFELEMLLMAYAEKVTFRQVPIETVYLNHNAASHFNPAVDSVRIYWVFVRFVAFYLLPLLVDFVVFMVAWGAGLPLWLSILVGKVSIPIVEMVRARLGEPDGLSDVSRRNGSGLLGVAVETVTSYGLTLVGMTTFGGSAIAGKLAAEAILAIIRVARFRWNRADTPPEPVI